MGSANIDWVKGSGGVKSIATTKQPTTTYGRFSVRDSGSARPAHMQRKTAMGISNAMPNAKNIVKAKLRKLVMSGAI